MLTAIVPLYNEDKGILSFHNALSRLPIVESIIYVDDGSSDETLRRLRSIVNNPIESKAKYISLGRNYGKEIALLCGLDHCNKKSDIVVLDGDGQHPVEVIAALYSHLSQDIDVVFASRISRRYQGLVSRFLSKGYYRILRAITGMKVDDELGDFFCAKADYAKALRLYRSPSLFFKCVYPDVGFRSAKLPVAIGNDSRPSRFGKRKKLSIASSSIFYTSGLPLRVIAPLGFLVSAVSVIALLIILIQFAYGASTPPGYLTIAFLINFYSGIIVLILGILARYLELAMRDALRKPVYTVKERCSSH
jgi:polyisoprenyl-phosphate glycosyltransferase